MERESSSRNWEMSQIVVEMREAIIELAGDRGVFDSRALWLERAARLAGITPRMAKRLFYGECADPKASVVERVRAARARKSLSDAELGTVGADRHAALLDEIEFLREAVRVSAPDVYRAYCDGRRIGAAARGEVGCPVD
jgi:hypothetical protein